MNPISVSPIGGDIFPDALHDDNDTSSFGANILPGALHDGMDMGRSIQTVVQQITKDFIVFAKRYVV